MKLQTISLVLAATLLLTGCKANSEMTKAARQEAMAIEKAPSIPYMEAKNYFLLNNVEQLPTGAITSEKEFNGLFGAAATMGEGGQPTPIDFSCQMVLAISRPATNRQSKLEVVDLKKPAGTLIFRYRCVQGDTLSYQIRPTLILVVDKKHQGNIEFREVQ